MNNTMIEITFWNVDKGEDFKATMDSHSTALDLATMIKSLTDSGHVVSGIDLTDYDDPIEMLLNTTNPGEEWSLEDASKCLSEAIANGWNFAPDVDALFILDLYTDMEPTEED